MRAGCNRFVRTVIFFLCAGLSAYEPHFYDYSKKIEQPTAVAIIAYNRPHYLKRLLESLAENPEADTLPFFFFLDGGSPDAQAENLQLIEEACLTHKIPIVRPINYGCPKNHIDAKRFLFDWCQFDRIVVMEEDLIVTKNYLATLLSLHDWANKKYSNIGAVQLWSNCRISPEQKRASLSLVREVTPHWTMVTYCLGRNVWNDISPLLTYYETTFIDPLLGREKYNRARSKPQSGPTFNSYQHWIQTTVRNHKRDDVLDSFSRPIWKSKYQGRSWSPNGDIPMNQDQITSLSIWLAGYTRIQTVVNRVSHIGEKGISPGHRTNTIYLDEFPEDGPHLHFKREH